MNQGKEGIAAKPRRGRFIAPIADLSALADYRIILFISIIVPIADLSALAGCPEHFVKVHYRPAGTIHNYKDISCISQT